MNIVHGPDRPLCTPVTYETYFMLFLGLFRTCKLDATIAKLGWTTCVTPFLKWPPTKFVELHFRL